MDFLNILFYYLKSRKFLSSVLLSIISLILVFLNLIQLNLIVGISKSSLFYGIFRISIILGSIYIILFLPSYPFFFFTNKLKEFNKLEKLSLTIISNTCFYIISGYIGFLIGIPMIALYFFLITLIIFFLIIVSLKYRNIKDKTEKLTKNEEILKDDLEKLSLIDFLKKKLSLNSVLFIIFILLICMLNLVRNPYFFGTDPWLHILIIKKITEMNLLPLLDYHNELGIHIFCAVIQFFSGVDHLFIPRYFGFFTYLTSALLLYNIFMRIFKNQNLALFGVFLLEFSMLGFSYMMMQFWPSGLAFIIGLTIFLLFYVRIHLFIQLDPPNKKLIISSLKYSYPLIVFLFIGCTLTHAITSLILLLPLVSTYLVYFLKDLKRGFDFLLLVGLLGIYLILTFVGLGFGHYFFLQPINIPWYLLIPVGIIGGWIIWRFKKSLIFTKGRFTRTIMGTKAPFIKKIEDRVIIPLVFSFLICIIVVFIIGNILVLNLDVSFLLLIFDIFAFFTFSFWGLAIFQKKPRGKPITMWALSINFIFLGVLFLDLLTTNTKIWTRVLYLGSVAIIIGFVSYIYKIVKTGYIFKKSYKIFFLFIVIFSLLGTSYYEYIGISNFSMKKREVDSFEWLSQYTSGKKVIHTEFGHDYILLYYDYPYEMENDTLRNFDLHFIIIHEENYFPPENHVDENGVNRLKQLKEEYGTDVYIIVDDFYFLNVGWEVYGHLSEEQQEKYYQLDYINKIHSSKDENGKGTPYYWII